MSLQLSMNVRKSAHSASGAYRRQSCAAKQRTPWFLHSSGLLAGTRCCSRRQSFQYVRPSHPQTALSAPPAGQTSGVTSQVP